MKRDWKGKSKPPPQSKLTHMNAITTRRFVAFLFAVLLIDSLTLIVEAQTGATSGVTYSGGMSGQASLTVAAAVVMLTQLIKWTKAVDDRRGPILVVGLSLIGVGFWGWATGDFSRATSFGYFAGWISVTTSAAGVYGFTRSGADAITSTTTPPSGAGASKTN